MLHRVTGNRPSIQGIKAALAAGRLSHSILLTGEKGTGTGFAARCLAADYLWPHGGDGARLVMESRAEDCIEVRGEGAAGEIRIDRIRQVRRQIFSTALQGPGRVVILYGAQALNPSSANALLKVLEEPPEGVLFILTATSAAAVLPTIRSRCVCFAMAPVSEEDCVAYLRQARPGCTEAEFLTRAMGGRIGSALACIDDDARRAVLEDAVQAARLAGTGDVYGLQLLLARREKDKPGARQLLEDLRGICAAGLGENPLVKELSPAKAAAFMQLAGQTNNQLAGNVSAKLALACLAARASALG